MASLVVRIQIFRLKIFSDVSKPPTNTLRETACIYTLLHVYQMHQTDYNC